MKIAATSKAYLEKKSKGQNETNARLNQQELDKIRRQIKKEEEKIATEAIVFDRMKSFLQEKINQKQQEQKKWQMKKREAEEELLTEITRLKKLKEANGKVLQEMREKQIENEMETHQ